MSKKSTIIKVSMSALMMQAPIYSLAQNDGFPPPPDFDNAFSSSGASASGKKEDPEILSKKKKESFNKAGIEEITSENFPEKIESFDFPNVEVTDLVKTISELTGRNFVVDPGIRGKITIIAPTKITVAEAYKIFLSALAVNGLTVVPSGSYYKIKSARNAQRDSIETYSGSYYPTDDQMITKIIHLKHISAELVNRDLRILPSKDADMAVYTATNSIIISDYGSNIDRIMKIINQLDVPGFDEQLEVVSVKYAKVKDIADLVDKIVNKGQKPTGGTAPGSFSSGTPRFTRSSGASGGSGNAYFMALPDDRTNSIIIVGNSAGITRVKKLISQLDFKVNSADQGGVYVYYVKHGDAEKIAQVLNGVTKELNSKSGTGAGAGPGSMSGFMPPTYSAVGEKSNDVFGGDVKITADKSTNSLVVVASKQDYEKVVTLLSKIDIARDQVFVEAIIMEMNMTDANSWGTGYYQYGPSGYGKAGFNGGININEMLSPQGGNGAILGFASGGTVPVTDPSSGKVLNIPSLIGFINFLKKTQKANILSTPQIMALDNQEAEIKVGDKVATSIKTTTSAGGATSSEANFEDASIELTIKPYISPQSNSIRMEIKQQVAQQTTVQAPKAIADISQPLAKRSIKTQIVVNNGDTAVLGGLMKDEEREDVTKVPLLGDLPIIGWLFKSTSVSKAKVNMLVFLTPRIIRNPSDTSGLIGRKLDQRLDFVKNQGGKDPFGARLDEVRANAARMKSAKVDGEIPVLQVPQAPQSPGQDMGPWNNQNSTPAPEMSPIPAPTAPPEESVNEEDQPVGTN